MPADLSNARVCATGTIPGFTRAELEVEIYARNDSVENNAATADVLIASAGAQQPTEKLKEATEPGYPSCPRLPCTRTEGIGPLVRCDVITGKGS